MSGIVKPLMSPGGTLLDISNEKHEAETPLNAKFSHRDLDLDSPISPIGLDSPDSPSLSPVNNLANATNGVAQKVIKDEGKKEEGTKTRSNECPTVRNAGRTRFDFPVHKIAALHKYTYDPEIPRADKNVSSRVAMLRRMKEQTLLDAQKLFLYDLD